jgi:hypothetical protein
VSAQERAGRFVFVFHNILNGLNFLNGLNHCYMPPAFKPFKPFKAFKSFIL